MKQELAIKGMTCANCSLSVTKAIERSGGKDIHVDFIEGSASFKLESDPALLDVIKAIESIGYSVQGEANLQLNNETIFQKINLEWSLIISVFCSIPLIAAMFVKIDPILQLAASLPILLVATLRFGKTSIGAIKTGIANMDVLVILGVYASFSLSVIHLLNNNFEHLYFETVGVIVSFVLLGKYIEKNALNNAYKAGASFKELLPEFCFKLKSIEDKEGEHIPHNTLKVGDLVLIREGDKIPADGKLLKGFGAIDESMLTGESLPIDKTKNDKVFAGTINASGNFVMMVLGLNQDTFLQGIIDTIDQAKRDKPKIQITVDKIASVFVPIVVLIAIGTFLGWVLLGIPYQNAILNGISVLVISCPCALGLATPTAISFAIMRGAKNGVYVKSVNRLEGLSYVKEMIFDKTGTLTKGELAILSITPATGFDEQQLIDVAYSLELGSSHPIANSIKKELKTKKTFFPLVDLKETKGIGVSGKDQEGNVYTIGRNFRTKELGITITKNEVLMGIIQLEDQPRKGITQLMRYLKHRKINASILSGDQKEYCEKIATLAGIEKVYYEKMPQEKLNIVRSINQQSFSAYLGDGINDTPSLKAAGVGLSMTAGSGIAINTADIVLANDNLLSNVIKAFRLSTRTTSVIKQNLFWAFFYNVIAIPLAVMGVLTPMIAAAAMSFSSVFVVLNSTRVKI